MRFEHIVLLIIAFNVVSALLQRRAKKAREKALRESGGVPAGPDDAWYEDDEAEEEPARRPGRPEPVPARSSTPADDGPQRQPSFAQDILDQIMRDLGLKPNPVPPPSAPPVPSPAPQRTEAPAPPRDAVLRDARTAREEEAARRERLERRERELEAESLRAREKIREWERLASSRTRLSGEVRAGEVRSTSSARPVAPLATRPPATVHRPTGAAVRPDLRDPRRLREAFVIKEILDAPLSRRPRH